MSIALHLRVLPSSVLPVSLSTPPDIQVIAYVSTSSIQSLKLNRQLPVNGHAFKGHLRRFPAPDDPSESNASAADDLASPPLPKVLNPSSAEAGKRSDGQEQQVNGRKFTKDVLIMGLNELPKGHVVIVGGIDEVRDWDLVRWVSIESPEASANKFTLRTQIVYLP